MKMKSKDFLDIRRIHKHQGKYFDCMSDHEVEMSLEEIMEDYAKAVNAELILKLRISDAKIQSYMCSYEKGQAGWDEGNKILQDNKTLFGEPRIN